MTTKELITHFDSTVKWFLCSEQQIKWWGQGNRYSCPWEWEVLSISFTSKGVKIYVNL